MSVVSEAADALVAALKTVTKVRYHRLGQDLDPPAYVLGMPQLAFDTYCPGTITSVTFPVFLIVGMDDRAQQLLWELAEPTSAAIEAETNAVITRAEPGMYPAGAQDLPSYTFFTEMSLK